MIQVKKRIEWSGGGGPCVNALKSIYPFPFPVITIITLDLHFLTILLPCLQSLSTVNRFADSVALSTAQEVTEPSYPRLLVQLRSHC